jgi:hypothetical protein
LNQGKKPLMDFAKGEILCQWLRLIACASGVVSGEFSKKADHGKWFGAKAKNHRTKENHDPPEAKRCCD